MNSSVFDWNLFGTWPTCPHPSSIFLSTLVSDATKFEAILPSRSFICSRWIPDSKIALMQMCSSSNSTNSVGMRPIDGNGSNSVFLCVMCMFIDIRYSLSAMFDVIRCRHFRHWFVWLSKHRNVCVHRNSDDFYIKMNSTIVAHPHTACHAHVNRIDRFGKFISISILSAITFGFARSHTFCLHQFIYTRQLR